MSINNKKNRTLLSMADQNGEGYLQRDFRFGATKGILEFFWDILVCHSSYNKNKTKKMFKI